MIKFEKNCFIKLIITNITMVKKVYNSEVILVMICQQEKRLSLYNMVILYGLSDLFDFIYLISYDENKQNPEVCIE